MLILTAIAILAVDFSIFPRRFAKVETWGTSLMDLGVGSFVFSNGIVSSRTLLKSLSLKNKPSFVRNVFNALKSGGTLLFLGLMRLFFVKKFGLSRACHRIWSTLEFLHHSSIATTHFDSY
ncbi:Gwt1p [Saccharomyces cerevisiae x Saccharomyces kudriavzevii VIN7]|uniref:GPI-anchored wall transfer protein 1 n=1 Tax=Saccharomyces cerevisiae x Saccharomyces kudriavzevii (strain VIN7) TaxID=1095631 RepID=H0GWR7_SACCK|nr:Gwt1p [Saccharomyces cerevisiae x Saccharomyces kudriavzevii VIN7]